MSIVEQKGERGGRMYLVDMDGDQCWLRRSAIDEDIWKTWQGVESLEPLEPLKALKRRKTEDVKEVYKCSNPTFKQKCNLLLVKATHQYLSDTRPYNNSALILDGPDAQTAFHLTTGTCQFLSQNVVIPNRVPSTCEAIRNALSSYQKPCNVITGEAYDVLKDQIRKKNTFSLVYLDWCGMTDEKTLSLLFGKGLQEKAIVAFTASYRNWNKHMKKELKKCSVVSNTFIIAIKEWFQQLIERHGYTLQHIDIDLNSSGGVGFWLAYVTY